MAVADYLKDMECVNKQAPMAESKAFSLSKSDVIMMWHLKLGHPNFHYLKRLLPQLFMNKNPNSNVYEACHFAKHTCSNGKEYFNSILGDYLETNGIINQSLCPKYTTMKWC